MSEIVEIVVEELDANGMGVARLDSGYGVREIHVASVLPGERARAEVVHRSPHRNAAWARVMEILTPARTRVEPACPNAGACGGCSLQHLAYPAQLEFKRKRVERALGTSCAGVCPSLELGYRNKAKYVLARADGRLVLGSYAPASHQVLDMSACRVPEPEVGSSRVDLQACKLEYSIVSPK